MTRENILDDFTAQVNLGIHGIIEQRCRLVLNTKPKRMSNKKWQYMIKKVLCIQYYPLELKP